MYLLPCRIQQGWGDVAEMAAASWALHRAGHPLLSLPLDGAHRPSDPRAVPVDPLAAGPVLFPPVEPLTAPRRDGRAIVLATWWGVAARRKDGKGGPLPGPLEGTWNAIASAHGREKVLTVSLEEFASAQTSRTALEEGLRQAGWESDRRRRSLDSAEGERQRDAYHRAFVLARGGERADVLHLAGTFAPDLEATDEFPFLLQVGPFGETTETEVAPSTANLPGRVPQDHPPRMTVVWYAGPPSSPRFAHLLLPGLSSLGRSILLQVRGGPDTKGALERDVRPTVAVAWMEEGTPEVWRRAWAEGDLRIASGSRTLVESVRLGRPFLYFNGLVQGVEEGARAFRREKLVSLVRALRETGGHPTFVRDLEAFADGHDVGPVLGRALLSAPWRHAARSSLGRVGQALPPHLRSGDAFLVSLAARFSRHEGPLAPFVKGLRREHTRLLQSAPPLTR